MKNRRTRCFHQACLTKGLYVDYAVEVRGLTKLYASRRGEPVEACRDVSFAITPGTVVGLLGPNGAGKTTVVKCILGLLRPTSGTALVHGVDVWSRAAEARRLVSAVLEGSRNTYWRLSVLENIEFFARLHGRHDRHIMRDARDLVGALDLQEQARAPVRTLSRGMQQKVAIACALIKQTPVLLLDEPTLGLDVEAARTLRWSLHEIARREGRTILVSGHDMKLVQEVCDRALIISRGRLVSDDSVERLLSLFQARGLVFRLAGQPAAELLVGLGQVADTVAVGEGQASEVRVGFGRPEQVYEIMEVLRTSGAVIERIESHTPDMEQTYLRLVRGGGGSGTPESR